MTARCSDLEKALRGESAEIVAAVEEHARACAACADELAQWRQISDVAPGLQKRWGSPSLWPGIHRALAAESQRSAEITKQSPARWWVRLPSVAAVASVLVVASMSWWALRDPRDTRPSGPPQTPEAALLTALDEVEAAERQYVETIDRLSRLAGSRVQAASPLMLTYREKLGLLDSAIAELRAGIETNRLNAHLRRELLATYREKQQTLQDLMKEVP